MAFIIFSRFHFPLPPQLPIHISNNHLRLHLKDFCLDFFGFAGDIKRMLSPPCAFQRLNKWFLRQAPQHSRDIGKYLWLFIEHLKKWNIKNECLWWWKLALMGSQAKVTLLSRTLSFVHALHVTFDGCNFVEGDASSNLSTIELSWILWISAPSAS